jgi:hypothetical protein
MEERRFPYWLGAALGLLLFSSVFLLFFAMAAGASGGGCGGSPAP